MDINAIFDEVIKEEPQKNKKGKFFERECVKCGRKSSVESEECECGYKFKKSDPKRLTDNQRDKTVRCSDNEKMYALAFGSGGYFVYAGSGPCPAKLHNKKFDGIEQFCEDVVDAGLRQGKIYTDQAIKLWLKSQLDHNEYSMLEYVDKWYQSKVEIGKRLSDRNS